MDNGGHRSWLPRHLTCTWGRVRVRLVLRFKREGKQSSKGGTLRRGRIWSAWRLDDNQEKCRRGGNDKGGN